MRINKAGISFDNRKFGFKSLRTDKNTVDTLRKGTKPISENQKLNIFTSLNNLASTQDRANIEFLLEVAQNLNYGQSGDSAFRTELDERGETPTSRENVDWSKALQETIALALANNTGDDVSDLQAEFEKIYSTKKELTSEQKELLVLRDTLNSLVIAEDPLADEEALLRSTRIRKNLDYFVASSEIPNVQKKECLEKFLFLLSDEYDINPQLENRRFKVMDEMLSDMLIKTPEDDVLTTKCVDQRQSGICAAISICRKAVAYEDKVRYMDIVMDELKNSPEMEVFDITELGTGKKILIDKAPIDYDRAIAKGYRIVDASAHIWMQNAHASGNGSILTESYTAFDDDTYDVFHDASWYEGLDANYRPGKQFMMALIKEREILKSIEKRQKKAVELSKTIHSTKSQILDMQGKTIGQIGLLFNEIFPEKSQSEITSLSKSLIAFYKGSPDDNVVNVPTKLDRKTQAKIIADYIKERTPEISQEQSLKLDERADKLLSFTADYVDYDSQLNKAKAFNSKTSKYRYYRNLFQAAAAHRLAVEADVNMPDGIIRHERHSNVPPKDIRVLEYMDGLKKTFSSHNVRAKFKDLSGNIPSQKELESEIAEDMLTIESKIPQELNLILDNIIGKDMAGVLSGMFKSIASIIDNGDKEMMSRMSEILMVKKEKSDVLAAMKKWSDVLDASPSSNDIQEAARALGFEDRMQAANVVIASFFEQLRTGISEEQYKHLVSKFGESNVGSALESTRLQFSGILDDYEAILEKWAVPSSRTLILDKMEKSHSVLSRKKLDKLKYKFDSISAQMVKNEKIQDLRERRKANEKAISFDSSDIEVLEEIEKSLSGMKKYSKNAYKDLNKYMFDALEQQYSYIGMLNGQFWVREEGSSGLSSNEQIRIIEQMTGQPYHVEYDVNDAVKQIKKGNGSGILTTSVQHDDYAFHAQYIPMVTSEIFTDPVTKQKVIQDVLWTDNSWGKVENDKVWNGHNGHYYTDYDRGFGWKDGFIVDKSFRIGQPVKDMHCAVGYAGKDKDKFGLFGDVVLQGTPTDTYQRLYKMFNNIFEMKEGERYLESLEFSIADGHKLDIDFLTAIDDLAEAYTDRLQKRIEKEIKTEADFNKLSEDDELKILMHKISLYFATTNPKLREDVYEAQTMQDIEEIKNGMVDEYIEIFASLMAKGESTIESIYEGTAKEFSSLFDELCDKYGLQVSQDEMDAIAKTIFFDEDEIKTHDGSIRGLERYFVRRVKLASASILEGEPRDYFVQQAKKIILNNIDEAIRIKSLESPVLANSPLKDDFIAAVDKYLQPHSDEELLLIIQGLQETGYEMAETFIEALEPEDVGLDFKPPYDYVRKYQSDDSNVSRAFSEISGTSFIYQQLGRGEDDNEFATPEDLYRSLHVKLSEMDVQKYVKKFKAEAFAKYKVRQAFPQPVVFSDENIAESVNNMLKVYEESIYSIKGNQFVLGLLERKNQFFEKYQDSDLYASLIDGEDVSVVSNEAEIEGLVDDLVSIKEYLEQDTSLSVLYNAYTTIIDEIRTSENVLSGKVLAPEFSKIHNIFADWEASGSTETKFMQNIKDEQARIRENIRVFVTSTIDPKYRNEAITRINEIITSHRKGYPVEEIEWLSNEFTGFVIARHITKNPTVLLKEAVKCLQEGKKDSEEYDVLKSYLLSALKVAQQTKVQYKLVQNQHEGISSKTKDMLSLFNVTLSDGSSQPMDSSTGMIYLIEQLRNQSDNNVTLNLFLEQSGLTENALEALIENFELQKSKEVMKENADQIFEAIEDIHYLGDVLNEYFAKSRIGYRSFEDAFAQITKYVERKTKHKPDSPMFKNFLDYMSQVQVKETTVAVKSQMFMDIVASVTQGAIEYLSNNINHKIEFVENIPELLADRADLMHAIKVPHDSEAYEKREEFTKAYMEVALYMTDLINEIYVAVTQAKNAYEQ